MSATNVWYQGKIRDMWMEKLIYGHIAIKITLGEAVVRGDLSAPKYVTNVCLYQKTVEIENDSAAKVG